MPFGSEIALSPGLSPLERRYIRLLGAPILGLRIRSRAILPLLQRVGRPRRIADAGSGRGIVTLGCARAFPDAEVTGVDLNGAQCDVNTQIVRRSDSGTSASLP